MLLHRDDLKLEGVNALGVPEGLFNASDELKNWFSFRVEEIRVELKELFDSIRGKHLSKLLELLFLQIVGWCEKNFHVHLKFVVINGGGFVILNEIDDFL